jgi:NhaP-type Na+/H+ or K+/H+ antiporter
VGLVVGWLVAHLQRHLMDPAVEIAVSLLTPFGAYVLAEQVHVSGVLATVAAGLCAGWWAPGFMAPETRLRSRAVWDMVAFLLNGLVFILIGLQLLRILPALVTRSLGSLIALGIAISVAAILVRFAWVFGAGELGPVFRRYEDSSAIIRRERVVVAWAGMRGVVSLATALALPLGTPERDLLVFVTFCVILVTLVGQGLTLPWLVRALGVSADGGASAQERRARRSRPRRPSPDSTSWLPSGRPITHSSRRCAPSTHIAPAIWKTCRRRAPSTQRSKNCSSTARSVGRCSMPSGRPCSTCADGVRWTTRRGGISNATSTWRPSASMRSRHRSAVSVVLVRHEARDVAGVITRHRASYGEIVQNLAWPVGYNAVALPLAAGALAGLGVLLPAWAGAAVLSASTIIVAMNAQTLRRLELQPAAARDERLGKRERGRTVPV